MNLRKLFDMTNVVVRIRKIYRIQDGNIFAPHNKYSFHLRQYLWCGLLILKCCHRIKMYNLWMYISCRAAKALSIKCKHLISPIRVTENSPGQCVPSRLYLLYTWERTWNKQNDIHMTQKIRSVDLWAMLVVSVNELLTKLTMYTHFWWVSLQNIQNT